MNPFFSCVSEAFNKTQTLLWPVKGGVWIRLFILYLFVSGCGNPYFNIPMGGGGSPSQHLSKSTDDSTPEGQDKSLDQKEIINAIKGEILKEDAPPLPFDRWKQEIKKYWDPIRDHIFQIVGAILGVALLIFLLFFWISSRLNMVLLKSLKEGRVAIRQFWEDTRDFGNSFFRFNISITILFMFVPAAFLAALVWWGIGTKPDGGAIAVGIISFLVVIIAYVFVFGIGYFLLYRFLPVYMQHRQKMAWDSIKAAWNWIKGNFGEAFVVVFLYCVLAFGVSMAIGVMALIVGFLVFLPIMLLGGGFIFLLKDVGVWAQVLFGGLGLILMVVLSILLYAAITVPIETFFTYLRIQLIEQHASKTGAAQVTG
jgi:hypothetical protein